MQPAVQASIKHQVLYAAGSNWQQRLVVCLVNLHVHSALYCYCMLIVMDCLPFMSKSCTLKMQIRECVDEDQWLGCHQHVLYDATGPRPACTTPSGYCAYYWHLAGLQVQNEALKS